MGREVYASLAGAMSSWNQLEAVSNNLANAATNGFRASRVVFTVDTTAGSTGAPATVGVTRIDNTNGNVVLDGVPTHVALQGEGFFSLADGSYTRDGAFRLDAEGQLVTRNGVPVLGEGGPLQLDPGEAFGIGPDGVVTGATSGQVGTLALVTLADARPLGGTRWGGTPTPVRAGEAGGVTVVQGGLEGSNVDIMRGMAELMEASRYFEAQQKIMQAGDEMESRLNRIGGS